MGRSKPWSDDPVFHITYFCNVRREDDKVTRWIREYYSPFVTHDEFEFNVALSRFINWPETLEHMGFMGGPNFHYVLDSLESKTGKVWGDAYIVSTCGRAMPKAQYLVEMVLPALYEALGAPGPVRRHLRTSPSLAGSYGSLLGIFGVQSFMAGQILADLKNTIGHNLFGAEDWQTWATPGPGSLRGISWIMHGTNEYPEKKRFEMNLSNIRLGLHAEGCEYIKDLCNQDLQNCLCEFDKYCRVRTGVGVSKRSYPGV